MTYRPDERCDWIVIHYSASPIETTYTPEQLERDHRARGFRETGYHAYGPRAGGWIEGRDLSEPGRFEQGAHSKGENDASIGYCYEGGVTAADPETGFDTRTPNQIKAMIEWIDMQLARFGGDGINPSLGPVVTGHRDMPGAATQCPGFDAGAWWRDVQASRPARIKADKPGYRLVGDLVPELEVTGPPRPKPQPDPAEQPGGILAALMAALRSIFGGKA